MLFNCYSKCIFSDDGSISFADVANIIIAFINLCLVVYIFSHQRKKEKNERIFQQQTKSKEFRHNWFKELIILPKIIELNSHFSKVEQIAEKLKQTGLTIAQRKKIDTELKAEFRRFSKEFVELLYAVNLTFADKIQKYSDDCLDSIQLQIHTPTKSLSVEKNFQSLLLENIRTYRNSIISNIYSFEDYV
ncbi:MAG: hypothetical protein Q7W13_07595 [Bacteroidia bacterium]|nr:hypothetical protein [Bacteroidia bacterium]